MATKAFYHPRGLTIDLGARLELWLYNEIAAFHSHRDKNDPVLTCLGNNEPMYVWKNHLGRYFVRHFPHGNPDGHVHPVLSRISDEHLRISEYGMRAGVAAGHRAELEVSTGKGTRLDVGIIGSHCNVGLEIQRSHLTAPAATRRAGLSFEGGFTTAWISDIEPEPGWADWVPTARLETRGGWNERVLEPNTAWVIIGDYEMVRDSSRRLGWSYRREPKLVLLDELAALMPAGDIVAAAVGTKGRVDLVFKAATKVIESCTYDGATFWDPVKKPVTPQKETGQRYSRDCHHKDSPSQLSPVNATAVAPRPAPYVPPIMLRPLPPLFSQPPVPKPLPVAHFEPLKRPRCGCGSDLLAPISVSRGYCERCRLKRSKQLHNDIGGANE